MTSLRCAMGLAVAAATLVAARPAAAAAVLGQMGGHLAVGYAQLFATDAPGGSLSIAGGLDVPATPRVRAGIEVGYHLLGSRGVLRGSLSANVDYSVFEVAALAHWLPERLGPVARVTAGPALFRANADLSTAGTGAAFSDLAVGEVAPGVALAATLMRRSPAPVRMGLELATRVGFVRKETWTVATARLAFHY